MKFSYQIVLLNILKKKLSVLFKARVVVMKSSRKIEEKSKQSLEIKETLYIVEISFSLFIKRQKRHSNVVFVTL